MKSILNVHKYNGKIEFLRFVFCICVLLFHGGKYILGEASLKNGIHASCFVHGSIGVEFFFVLSGFLMAKSVYKKTHSDKIESLGNETFNFMTRKIKGFLPEHIISFIFALITYIIMENFVLKKIINYVIESLPSFFLLQMLGVKFEIQNNI